jgi:MoaA/NifB/PqqE/SkfB family radical SAM enzyme
MERVIKTEKGIFIRQNNGFGTLVFSPFSGLFFAIKELYDLDLLNYCNEKSNNLPPDIINHLNIGMQGESINNFEIAHYLPKNEIFSESNKFPDFPIVVNWLISNKCNFNCSYCYASDVNDKPYNFANINKVAENILSLNPLAVVISGGEPLLEKEKMIQALNILGNKVGIIVDTNGSIWDEEIVQLFIKYKVVVRVSLDSMQGKINRKIRPYKNKNQDDTIMSVIINNIYRYRKQNIPVLIHSVITSFNKDLEDMFTHLSSFNVNGWRIFSVVKPNDIDKQKSFYQIMNYRSKKLTLEDQQLNIRKKIDEFVWKHSSKSNFSVQAIPSGENEKNSVILVLPDGRFTTESKYSTHKTDIKLDSVFSEVNQVAHFERYLGKIKKI